MRRAFIFAGLVLAACHSRRPLDLPQAPADTQSMLLAVDPPTGEIAIAAFEWPDGRPSTLALERNSVATVLFYADSLATLGLEPGPVKNATGKAFSSPLPSPAAVFEGSSDGDGFLQAWTTADGIRGDLGDFRIEGAAPTACAERGGCFTSAIDVADNRCVTPCATPQITAPTEPTPVDPPSFTPCPPSWVTTMVDDIAVCVPPSRACSGDQLIDQTACDGVGSACAADGWPTDLPKNRAVLYVDPAAAAGGIGSRAAPYQTLGQALDAAPAVAAIALARGNHAATTRDVRGVIDIVGGCTGETMINGLTLRAVDNATILTVRDVTVAATGTAVEVMNGAAASVVDAVVSSSGGSAALTTNGGRIDLTRVVFDAPSGGAVAMTNGSGTIDHVLIRNAGGIAIELGDDSDVDILDTVVTNSARSAVRAGANATLDITRALFMMNQDDTLQLDEATAVLTRVVVDGSRATGNGNGRAIHAVDSNVTANWLFTRDTETSAIRLDGSELTLTDVVIRDVAPQPDNKFGMGIAVLAGGTLNVERVDVADTRRWGINILQTSRITGSHLSIARVLNGEDVRVGFGLEVSDASVVSLDVVRVMDVTTVGVGIDLESTCRDAERTQPISIDNLTIASTRTGFQKDCGGEMDVHRAHISNISGTGVDIGVGIEVNAVVNFDDLVVDGAGFRALDVDGDGRFVGNRVQLLDTRWGMSADYRGRIDLRDLLIDCTPTGDRQGIAVRHKNFGVYDVADFELRNCTHALWLRYEGSVATTNGYIHDNAIAVETPDFNIQPFMLNVRFENNDTLLGEYDPMRD